MSSLQRGELPIGKLSKELDISTATINFYVKEGILPPPRKINKTRAAYSDRHRRLLVLLKRMQANGYSLHYIRAAFQHFGTDEEGLHKLESVGHLHPLPPVRNDPERRPIEPFDAVGRDAFIELAEVDSEIIDQLESWGVLRPRAPDAYDARDLWLVRTVQSLVDDGIALERLEFLEQLVPVAADLSWVVMDLVLRYLPALRNRDKRFTDLVPYAELFGYLINRMNDEQHPHWRERLFMPDPKAGWPRDA